MEGIAWLITCLVVLLIVLPITHKIYRFPFLFENIYFVILTITLLRHIFLLKFTIIARVQWVKALLILSCVPLFLYTLKLFKGFQEFLSEEGVESVMIHLPHNQQMGLGKYITSEILFFAGAAMICTIALAFRLLISIWRQHNKGTV